MVQNSHKCTRRKAIAYLGTSAVLSTSLGLASARERRSGRAAIVENLRRLQSEHGSSKVSSISFTYGSNTHISTNEHETIIAKYKGKRFENCQVETIEFEDGHEVIQVTLLGGRHVETVLEGNNYSYTIADEMIQRAA